MNVRIFHLLPSLSTTEESNETEALCQHMLGSTEHSLYTYCLTSGKSTTSTIPP